MSSIAFCVPTRNRPNSILRFATAVYTTAHNPADIDIHIYVDDDDQATLPALECLKDTYGDRIKVLIGPRIVLSDTHNQLFRFTTSDIICVGSDDVLYTTPGWDTMVLNKFSEIDDRIAMVYGDDLLNPCIATHPILHRRWIEALGYVMPPYFAADYGDTWLDDIAVRLGRRYKLPFITEHLHYLPGKAVMDDTYREARERARDTQPIAAYNQHTPERLADVEKLRKLLGTPYTPRS